MMEPKHAPDQPDVEDRRHLGVGRDVEGFVGRARETLHDQRVHDAIALGTRRLVNGRKAALNALPDAPELRERAYHIKQRTMSGLDRYLEQFAEALEARGGHVHFAADGDEVVRYVGDLARRREAKIIVKSKSMATEEIELNRRLEERYQDLDLEIVETDLGEWIAQIAGVHPFHIVAPILHMDSRHVADVLSPLSEEPLPPNVQDLMLFARKRLREKFLTADIGITGANFAVAETGTIVTCTNEGNGRLVSSVPPVHVVVVGIEKLVPSFEDLSVFLNLLGRSGTGQKLTVYTHLVTGPRREGELDGPEELHVVFLDNGRSKLLGSEFEEALYCIRCGACLNVCPVYRQAGGYAYGSTYSGPIGAVLTPLLQGDEEAKDLPHASSLCGACWEACPVGIPLHDLLIKLRNRQVEEGLAGKAQQLVFTGFKRGMQNPTAYRLGTRLSRLSQRPLVKDGKVRSVPGPLAAWTDFRDLPPLAEKSFHRLWKEGI